MDEHNANPHPETEDAKAPRRNETASQPPGSLTSIHIRRAAPHHPPRAAEDTRREAVAAQQQPDTASVPPVAAQARPRAAPPARPIRPEARSRPRPERPVPPRTILSYWLETRQRRILPALADLDDALIQRNWPNSILMRCRAGAGGLEPVRLYARAAADAAEHSEVESIELSSTMLHWMIGLAGQSVRDLRPKEDEEVFSDEERQRFYHACALPLSDDQQRVDHVLCNIRYADNRR